MGLMHNDHLFIFQNILNRLHCPLSVVGTPTRKRCQKLDQDFIICDENDLSKPFPCFESRCVPGVSHKFERDPVERIGEDTLHFSGHP